MNVLGTKENPSVPFLTGEILHAGGGPRAG
jgi:hypothetical protein